MDRSNLTPEGVYPLVSKLYPPARRPPKEKEKDLWNSARYYHVFHVFDAKGRLIGFYPARSSRTILRMIKDMGKRKVSLLYRGLYHIPAEVWRRIKQVRKGTKGFGAFELSKRYIKAVPSLQELIQRPYYFFIDINAKDEETQKNLDFFLRLLYKRGIEPFLYETQRGYHAYIQAFHAVHKTRKVLSVKGEEVEVEELSYVPAFPDDPRLEYVLSALKRLLAYAGLKADKVSYKHAVWMECFPNACKGGFASKLLREGKPHTVGYLFNKLKDEIAVVEIINKSRENKTEIVRKLRKRNSPVEVSFPAYESSCVFDYLNNNEIRGQALRYLRLTGGDIDGLRAKLESLLPIKRQSDQKALDNFLHWVVGAFFSWLTQKQREKRKKNRKHLHFYELLPYVKEALEKDNIKSYQEIANYVSFRIGRKVGKSSVYDLIKLAGGPERILNEYEEVERELKARAKGGDRRPKLPLDEYLDKLYQEAQERVESIREGFRAKRSDLKDETKFNVPLVRRLEPFRPSKASPPSKPKVFSIYFFDLEDQQKTETLKALLREFEEENGYEVVALTHLDNNLIVKELGVKVGKLKKLWRRLKQSGLRVMGLPKEFRERFYEMYQKANGKV